jgi:putative ABC transport system ATP-binding protein
MAARRTRRSTAFGGVSMASPPPAASARPILQLEQVGRTFQMGAVAVEVLKDINLEVRQGEVLAIVGPSGSGKSTILNLIGGLDQPSVGKVFFQDDDLTKASAAELTRFRRDHVGFVFQFYNLVPNLTARENVQAAAELCKKPLDIDWTLGKVDLSERAHHFPAQMAGGEQQRVAIARAIAKSPSLLLCDEPTGALDFETGKKVLRVLLDLNRDLGMTVILITHNTPLAQVAQRIVYLRSGRTTHIEENTSQIPPEEVVW